MCSAGRRCQIALQYCPGGKMPNEYCGICRKLVRDDDEALCCDKCEKWFHRGCQDIGKTEFKKLERSKDPWNCDICKKKVQNSNKIDTKKDKDYTIGDVMAKLLEMENNYNKLFQKYEEQLGINNELKKELQAIKHVLNDNEQKTLNNNIIIQGIPAKENENIQGIVEKIAKSLKVVSKVQLAYRMGGAKPNKANPPIRITFESQEDKKKWMMAKKNSELTTEIIGQFATPEPIYINHDLTKQNFQLFREAKQFKKDNNFKYLWVSNGKILLRKTDVSKTILVRSSEDLKN